MNPQTPPPETRPPEAAEVDWRHPWRSLREAVRLLWRLSWQSDPHLVRRFVVLYGSLLAVLLLLGEAFLLLALGVLRALWLAAPLYPGVARWLARWGWPGGETTAPPAATPWRTLHTVLWIALVALALGLGGWLLVTRGFCAQNLICLAWRLWGGEG